VGSADELRGRTKRFAFDILALVKIVPPGLAAEAVARQLVRSGPGICANHRAAGRARSLKEFVARLSVALEETDETEFWLEALLECALAPRPRVEPCLREVPELRAILYASVQTARTRARRAADKTPPAPPTR
jgi:four helix bundle protein